MILLVTWYQTYFNCFSKCNRSFMSYVYKKLAYSTYYIMWCPFYCRRITIVDLWHQIWGSIGTRFTHLISPAMFHLRAPTLSHCWESGQKPASESLGMIIGDMEIRPSQVFQTGGVVWKRLLSKKENPRYAPCFHSPIFPLRTFQARPGGTPARLPTWMQCVMLCDNP